MRPLQFEKIQDGAYFVVDPSSFEVRITGYDPVTATQTIAFDSDEQQIQEDVPPEGEWGSRG